MPFSKISQILQQLTGDERVVTIQKVMVVGAGQMGSGIAQVCAQAGLDVKLNDMKQEFFERGIGVITKI